MADKLLIMQNGKVLDQGSTEEVLHNPKSDYTRKLWQQYRKWRERVLFEKRECIFAGKIIWCGSSGAKEKSADSL